MDIVAYPPARPITAEIAADRATNFGYNPLELCFETPGERRCVSDWSLN